MGTWGPGNFENDTAADHLSDLMSKLIREIDAAMADPGTIEPDEYWGVVVPCNLELLWVLAMRDYVGCKLPEPGTVRVWKETFLGVWDEHIDALQPKPEYKKQRRETLVDTFDRLMGLAQEFR